MGEKNLTSQLQAALHDADKLPSDTLELKDK